MAELGSSSQRGGPGDATEFEPAGGVPEHALSFSPNRLPPVRRPTIVGFDEESWIGEFVPAFLTVPRSTDMRAGSPARTHR
jgi:hypothetical protein